MILSAAYLARMAFSQGVSPCIVAHPLSPRATTAAIITRFIIASLLLLEFTIRPALGQTGERFDSFDLLRSEEHTSELQSLMRISYAVFCLKKKKTRKNKSHNNLDTDSTIK